MNDMCVFHANFRRTRGEGYVDLMDILPCVSRQSQSAFNRYSEENIVDRAYQMNRLIVENDPLMGLPLVCHEYIDSEC